MNKENIKFYCKKKFSRLGQFLYLTVSNFNKNNLWESASACTFGFVFSFIPVTLIIFTVLVALLKGFPNIYDYIVSFTQEIENLIDIQPMLNSLMEMQSLNIFNIFLGVWVIWMARKLFNSIITAVNKIFRSVSRRKTWFNQILSFIIEFVLILIIAVIIFATFAFNQLLELPFFKMIFGNITILYSQGSHNIVVLIIYMIIFVSTFTTYRVISGTKPMFKRCFFYAAMNTISFFLVSFFIDTFINVTNYNTIYGTISSLVLLMFKVYFFFVLFLFYAQMIYVSQFYDILLRSEIYLLPNSKSGGWQNDMKRILFINPSEIQTPENTVFFNSGDIIFKQNEKLQFVFYLKRGTIKEESSRKEIIHEKGSFIGDVQCILNENYSSKAVATSDCELIRFTPKEFMDIIEKSHHAARKAISKISEYTTSFYDENENENL